MKYIGFFLLLPFLTHSQNKLASSIGRGASPIEIKTDQSTSGTTYAVVIGISDYQDKDIPDLRFADKDAEAFANFLRSPAGGALDGDHLQVLTNTQATAGRIAEALDALIEKAKKDDQVVIYFSGHGDIEGKKLTQPGFLLCWDAPSRVYMGGGTYSLSFLQEVVSTLSVQNQAKVIVITDACHAGKLAGSQIGGAQLTTANLAKQYANEVKILSCQPNEFSLEGPQWGGGRGVFSYHLVDGLFGLADRNNDGQITLGEIDRYLEDKVTGEAAPQSQVPILLGNKTDRIATVNANILADLKKNKTGIMAVFAATESRGFEEEILAKVDTSIRVIYNAFKKAVREKRFFKPVGNSAEEYFTQLNSVEALAPLRGIMKRNYAAGLQDDAQQTLNEWLKTNQEVSLEAVTSYQLPQMVFTEEVKTYPQCLERAAKLLGNNHYMYSVLKARKYFFEGYLLANSNKNPNQELGENALALFRQSLEWQPEQPQVYWQMSLVFVWNLLQPDSLEYYTRLAMEVYPNWTRPCLDAAFWLSYKYNRQDRARLFLELASQIDSNSAEVVKVRAVFNFGEKNYTEAEQQFRKAIELDSTDVNTWINLGNVYIRTRRYAEAEPIFKNAIALDSTYGIAWTNLGAFYNMTQRYAEAETVLKKAIALDSTYVKTWSNLGSVYLNTGKFEDAELYIKKAISLDSMYAIIWNNLGFLYIETRRYAEAETVFKKAISKDSTLANPVKHLGQVYFKTNRPEAARKSFLQAIALNPNYTPAMLGMAYLLTSEEKAEEAIGYVEQAISKGVSMEQLEKDEDLAPLRAAPEWKAMMKKYFPDKVKD